MYYEVHHEIEKVLHDLNDEKRPSMLSNPIRISYLQRCSGRGSSCFDSFITEETATTNHT